jgi:formate-dependent nitrite reductase membrane component NrfD
MCPLCLTIGLYAASGVSAGAGTIFLAAKLLRKRPEPTASTTSTETEGDDHAATEDRIEK